MQRVTWLRRVLSVVLLVCMALPLARCTSAAEVTSSGAAEPARTAASAEAVKAAAPVQDIVYAGKLMANSWPDNQLAGVGDYGFSLMLLLTFIGPAASLLFSPKTQSIAHLVTGIPALALLTFLMLLYGEPMIGGVLAIASWSILLGLGLHGVIVAWRMRRAKRLT